MTGWYPPLKTNLIRKRWSEEVRGIALELYGKIQDRTPVETGVAVGNWTMTIRMPAQDWNPSQTVPQTPMIAGFAEACENFIPIWISNNVPYIGPLEYGHSRVKSPQGMVRVSIAEIEAGYK